MERGASNRDRSGSGGRRESGRESSGSRDGADGRESAASGRDGGGVGSVGRRGDGATAKDEREAAKLAALAEARRVAFAERVAAQAAIKARYAGGGGTVLVLIGGGCALADSPARRLQLLGRPAVRRRRQSSRAPRGRLRWLVRRARVCACVRCAARARTHTRAAADFLCAVGAEVTAAGRHREEVRRREGAMAAGKDASSDDEDVAGRRGRSAAASRAASAGEREVRCPSLRRRVCVLDPRLRRPSLLLRAEKPTRSECG